MNQRSNISEDENENETLIESTPIPKQKQYNYFHLFRYATRVDTILIIIFIIMSLVAGASMPAASFFFGKMTRTFQQQDQQQMREMGGKFSLYFIGTGIIVFLATWLMYTLFTYTGERQAIQFRKHYLESLMNQEIGWFDSIDQHQLNSKMNLEVLQIQESISEQLSYFLKNAFTAGGGIIIALILGWQLALVILGLIPFLAIMIVLVVWSSQKMQNLQNTIVLQVAGIVEQALVALKTVKVLNGCLYQQDQLQNIFNSNIVAIKKFSIAFSLSFGAMYFIQLCIYSIGFYYGSHLISSEIPIDNKGRYYDSTNFPTIFFCVLWGSLQLSKVGTAYARLIQGLNAGRKAFEIIDRIPKKLTNMEGRILQVLIDQFKNFAGEIEFRNVEFQYERSDKIVLKGINFKVKAGQRVAFVGKSGCGKSTIFSLIQKFYETYNGSIFIGSEQIETKELDSNDFYRQIVVVNQEPTLFSGSIKDNLLFGNQNATDEEIQIALKQSNAMEFIEKLPLGWNTNVGIGGNQLSGGQKQRIAIARALLKKPKLILLDEATSALDRVNEKRIQQTLDLLSKNTTTLIIAHRLTTVQNADIIYMIEDGLIVEQGNHKELMGKGGKYAELVSIQINENEEDILIDDGELEQVQEEEIISSNSIIQQECQKTQDQDKVQLKYSVIFKLILYSKTHHYAFIFGMVSALINGCLFPIFSIYEAIFVTIMIELDPKLFPAGSEIKENKRLEFNQKTKEVSTAFLVIGVVYFFFTFLEIYYFNSFANNLIITLRVNLLTKYIRMPLSYFDSVGQGISTSTKQIGIDCQRIYQFLTTTVGQKLQQVSAYISGFSIAFYNSWIITLVAIGISPISYLSRFLKDKYFIMNQSTVISKIYSTPETLTMEIIHNIRTVCSFNNKEYLINQFMNGTIKATQAMQRLGFYSGLAEGLAESQFFIISATFFYIGTILISENQLTVAQLFGVLFAIIFTVLGGTKDMNFETDIPKSILATNQIFEILNLQDEYQLRDGRSTLNKDINGNIEFRNVSFKYPTRDQFILKNLNFTIKQGEKIGFVGESGCGKSTIIQLITRLYEPTEGCILIDDVDIRDYDIDHLRNQVQVITQEPSLFEGTIEQNIRFNLQHITLNDIIEVSKQAEAYDFITKEFEQQVEQGYQKQVGMKGVNLSGGQKQRIAIARTLLRDGHILLLDEATSALDTKTEDVVQKNIDRMMKSKTRITVAHRFNTIMDSDIIYMFDNGQIVESGTYENLINLKGSFFNLQQGIRKQFKQEIQ